MDKTYNQRLKDFIYLAKPTGPICNLDCHYCFYTEKEAFFSGKSGFRDVR